MSVLPRKAATTTTYQFVPDDIKNLIAADLGVSPSKVSVYYKIGDLDDRGDPYYSGPRGVVGIEVTVKE